MVFVIKEAFQAYLVNACSLGGIFPDFGQIICIIHYYCFAAISSFDKLRNHSNLPYLTPFYQKDNPICDIDRELIRGGEWAT